MNSGTRRLMQTDVLGGAPWAAGSAELLGRRSCSGSVTWGGAPPREGGPAAGCILALPIGAAAAAAALPVMARKWGARGVPGIHVAPQVDSSGSAEAANALTWPALIHLLSLVGSR